MLDRAAMRFLNHLLSNEAWARSRLRPFAGQKARFSLGPLALDFSVTSDGTLVPARQDSDSSPAVAISLPDDAPLLVLSDRDAIFASARITGSADFAETLGFIARNLRWDSEADLAGLVGDIAAHRISAGARSFFSTRVDAAHRFTANVGEFLTQESASVARKEEVASFCAGVDILRDDLARLEVRIARLR